MVECEFSKLVTGVRFTSPAPNGVTVVFLPVSRNKATSQNPMTNRDRPIGSRNETAFLCGFIVNANMSAFQAEDTS